MVGGYWGVIAAVPTPGAPFLTITQTGPTAVMAPWPSPSTGYNLQVNTHLATTNWVAPVESVIGRGQPKSKQHKETSRSQVLELKCAAAKIFCNRQPWLPYLRLYAKQDFFEFTCLELVCPCRLHN
jgi:hypothetical protein